MKLFIISLFILLFDSCTGNKIHLEYFSVAKSHLNVSYGRLEDNFNFYKFQKYYQSAKVDSVYLENYLFNFEDSAIYNFLKNIYTKRGYDHSIKLLSEIGRINTSNLNDTSIIVIDLNDSISLINLSPEFSIYALGSCCSPYQNLILRKRKNKIIFIEVDDELSTGKLIGIYLNKNRQISGLLFQGYSNSNGAFKGLNSTYNLKYNITEKGIFPDEILNVRGGEPFDKNDLYIKNICDLGLKNVIF